MANPTSHVKLIESEFEKRRRKNPRYSLRAFAKHLGVHASLLSRVFSGKQALSPKSAERCAKKLNLSREEKRLFLQSVLSERQRLEVQSLGMKAEIPSLRISTTYLDAEATALVFNLTAHSILQLTFVEDFRSEPEWIAGRLGIPVDKVQANLNGLITIGLLKWENGRLVNPQKDFVAIKDVETDRIRRAHQKGILDAAIQSLENDDIERRAHYALTLVTDSEKLKVAREMIRTFLESMNDFLETGEKKEVYQLAVQLFPLDTKGRML